MNAELTAKIENIRAKIADIEDYAKDAPRGGAWDEVRAHLKACRRHLALTLLTQTEEAQNAGILNAMTEAVKVKAWLREAN